MAEKAVVKYDAPILSTTGTTINIDFDKELVYDYESEAPLTTLLSKLQDQAVYTNSFKFAVGRAASRVSAATSQMSAGAVAAAGTLVVDDGEYFNVDDVIEVPDTNNDATHDNLLRVSVISGDTLTVYALDETCGVPLTAASAVIRRITSAMPENDSGRKSHQTVPSVYTQYTHTYKNTYDVSWIQAKNRQYIIEERIRLRNEVRQQHVVDMEYSNFLMKKGLTEETTPRYTQSGLEEMITSNILEYGSSLEADELWDFIIQIHSPAYSAGNKRMVFSSIQFLSKINKLALAGNFTITPKDTTWGVSISQVIFAGFTWEFVIAPVLSAARSGYAFVVHPPNLKKRTLIPTLYQMNIQLPEQTKYKDGFYSVNAIQHKVEETAGIAMP